MTDAEWDRSWNVELAGARTIHDADGAAWTVREVLQPLEYDSHRRRSLVFTTDGVMRRIRSYPANWATLSEAELFALSLGR